MQNGENPFRRWGTMQSGLREERRGHSQTQQYLGSISSPISPSMGVHPQTIFLNAAMDYEQHLEEDYGAGSSAVAGVELERIIAGGNHEVQGSPGAANANCQGRSHSHGHSGRHRHPSCPHGGILHPANGAA